MKSAISLLAGLVVAASLAGAPALARSWKSTPQDLAQDYSQILDNRGKGEVVMVWWLVPTTMPEYPDAQKVLDRYLVIGVVHAKIDMAAGGVMSFDPAVDVVAKDADGNELTRIDDSSQPPVVSAMLAGMQGVLSQAIGQMGQGIHWIVFDTNSVHACQKGGLSVQYAGETYTYQTPIPGCPAG
ncbi:MAG TPA: hypothetical protein VMH86_16400 [Rhizomicrobium sp.]|nr:hypothetical protein [Rhizomicrobium sp.]